MPNPLGDSTVAEANPLGDSEVAGNPLGDAPVHAQAYQPGEKAPGMTDEDAAFLKDLSRSSRTEGSFQQKFIEPAAQQAMTGVNLPDIPEGVTAAAGPEGAMGGAIYEGAVKPAVNAITSPATLALAPLGVADAAESVLAKVVGRGVSGAFAADMLKSSTDEAKQAVTVLRDPKATDEQKMTAVTKAAATLGFGVLAGAHATSGVIGEPDMVKAREELNAKLGENPLGDKPAPEPEAAPAGNPLGDQQAEDPLADRARYEEIQPQMLAAAKSGDHETLAKLFKENEDIKNRNSSDPGMPPESPGEPDRQTNFGQLPTVTEGHQGLRKLLSEHDDSGDTVSALADRVETMIEDGTAPESLKPALDEYRQSVDEDFTELGMRGDVEAYEGKFEEAVRKAAGNPENSSTVHVPRSVSAGSVDLSPIEKAKTSKELYTTAGKMLREENDSDKMDIIRSALQKRAEELENPATESATSKEPTDYGIAARVTAERAAGGAIEPVEPGAGIAAEASVEQGRADLKAGADPQAALDRFNQTGAIKGSDIGLVRAQGEALAKAASDAANEHGIDSPEYKAASKADSDWTQAIKPMQTEWHRAGQAMQGSTDIDTGDFHSMATSFREATGRDFTPEQATQAKAVADKVKGVNESADAANKKWSDTISKEVPEPEIPKGPGVVERFKSRADAAMERLQAKMGRASAGIDPTDLKDYADIAAYHIVRGLDAAAELVKDFGEGIREHLPEILRQAKAALSEGDTSVAAVWKKAKDYIDAGETDPATVRSKIATDLGIPVQEVTEKLAAPKNARVVTDEMYARNADRRAVVTASKNWLKDQQTPGWLRFVKSVPRAFFNLATFGHGTVGPITHAAVNIFDPKVNAIWAKNFLRGFKMMGWTDGGAFHEQMVQNLTHDPNFILARRAGLANDPMRLTDDYQQSWNGTWFRKAGLSGQRGFDALKTMRQGMFNKTWDELPASMQTKLQARMIADAVNHSTGALKMQFPEWTNWTFFAPKLEGSRWAWMVGDPLKAGEIIKRWKDASPEEQHFAIQQVRQKATIAGVYLGLLAANQGLLSAFGSKQQVNVTDPSKSDFLSFKAAGHNIGLVGPMLGTVRLLANLLHISVGSPTPQQAAEGKFDRMATQAGEYTRNKLSPFAGVAMDVATQADFMKKPLPFATAKPVSLTIGRKPNLSAKSPVQPYTYKEYIGEHLAPIPIEEAVRVWHQQGMHDSDIKKWMDTLISAVSTGATGVRISEDTSKPAATPSPLKLPSRR